MDLQKLREWWRRQSNFLRLKVHEDQPSGPKMHDMGRLLLKEMSSETSAPPQVLQGMWQAYGQMRAARTTARGAILATGLAGAGFFLYQKKLNKLESELDAKKAEVEEKNDTLKELENEINLKKTEVDSKDRELEVKAQKVKAGVKELEEIARGVRDDSLEISIHRAVFYEACGKEEDENALLKEQCAILNKMYNEAFRRIEQQNPDAFSSKLRSVESSIRPRERR